MSLRPYQERFVADLLAALRDLPAHNPWSLGCARLDCPRHGENASRLDTLARHIIALAARVTAAEAAHAALAGAVLRERALAAEYDAAWAAHIAGGAPLDAAEGVLAMCDRLDGVRTVTDALLRGAPGGFVRASVVVEYVRAVDAAERDHDEVDRLADAIERGRSLDTPGLADANRRAGASGEALFLARTALDAALAAVKETR